MKEAEKHDAEDQKIGMCIRARWRCWRCGKHLRLGEAQLAHRIPKKKHWISAYGKEVIHHPLNMRVSCADCNSYANLDPAVHPEECERLVKEIKEKLKNG